MSQILLNSYWAFIYLLILDISSTLTSNGKKFTPYDPSQEPIFPPELKLNHAKYSSSSIQFGKDLNLVSKVLNALYTKIDFVRSHNYQRILFQSGKHDSSNNSSNEMSWFRPNSLIELLTLPTVLTMIWVPCGGPG